MAKRFVLQRCEWHLAGPMRNCQAAGAGTRRLDDQRTRRYLTRSRKLSDLEVILKLGPDPSCSEVQQALQGLCLEWSIKPSRVTKLLQSAQTCGVVQGILGCMRNNQIEVNVWHSNAAAGSFLDMRSWQRAAHLCAMMPSAALMPDVTTAAVLTRAFMESGKWISSLTHLRDMTTMRADISRHTKSFLAPCAARSSWRLSFWFLRSSATLQLQLDSVSIVEVISACKAGTLWTQALQLPLTLSITAMNSYLDVVSAGSRWRDILDMLIGMNRLRLEFDQISANTALNGVQRNQQWQVSLSCLTDFVEQSLQEDIVTHGSAVPLAAGTWRKCLAYTSGMLFQGTAVTLLIWNSVLNAVSVEARWLQAAELLGQLSRRSEQCDQISFTAGISAAHLALQWQTCTALAAKMSHGSIKHDARSCSSLSRACISWQGACTMLRKICREVRADTIMQNSYLDMFAESDWAWALDMSTAMQNSGTAMDEVSCGTLISTCQTWQSWPWAVQLLGKVRLLKLLLDTTSLKAA